MSDIDTVVMDSLKALDPNRPIREADIEALFLGGGRGKRGAQSDQALLLS